MKLLVCAALGFAALFSPPALGHETHLFETRDPMTDEFTYSMSTLPVSGEGRLSLACDKQGHFVLIDMLRHRVPPAGRLDLRADTRPAVEYEGVDGGEGAFGTLDRRALAQLIEARSQIAVRMTWTLPGQRETVYDSTYAAFDANVLRQWMAKCRSLLPRRPQQGGT